MKKVLTFVLFVCLTLTSISAAQPAINHYKKIDYIKINDGQLQSFLKLYKNELNTAYQQLVNSGLLESWALYKIKYPGGEKAGYDFISITTSSSIDSMESVFSDMTTPHYLPDNSSEKSSALNNICSLVKSELWKVENTITENTDSDGPSKYVTMDYMKVAPGKSPDYLMLEDEVAKPIHQERVNRGNMAGWEVYSLILPSGTEYGYNFSTFNKFNQLSNVEFGFTNEIINQTMGENANVTELFNTIYGTRDMVKVELWKLVTHTN